MKIELHFLQNFAPSNLNRDDTGAPKDCEFGGYRRARISSQCFKRAIRQAFADYELLGPGTNDQMAARTKRLVDETAKVLASKGKDEEVARALVSFSLQAAKLKVVEDNKTQYLLYVPRRIVDKLASLVLTHWGALESAKPKNGEATEGETGAKKKDKAKEKNAAKDAVPKEVEKGVAELFEDASKTPDLALFGRMIADNPEWNTEAACQVAHAISTNRVTMEFDFFTAVDDLKPKETAGSDMMGTVAFQSACFYRYSCVDIDALKSNLGGTPQENEKLARATLQAFLRASALAIPTGKQNSMAAQNRPSYMLAAVRKTSAPQSLVNAFAKPIRPRGDTSLVEASAEALDNYLDRSLALWGDADVKLFGCGDVESASSKRPERPHSFEEWVDKVVATAMGNDR